MASSESKYTADHETIRRWAEERGGKPAAVKGTSRSEDDPGMIRLDFPGYSGEGSLEEISWEEWFEKFDENDLMLAYQEETADGEQSNFNKIVSREAAKERSGRAGGRSSSEERSKKGGKASKASSSKKKSSKR